MRKILSALILSACAVLVLSAHAQTALAQTPVPDTVTFEKAKVLEVLSQEVKQIPGTEASSTYQTITAQILEGPDSGKTVTLDNDYLLMQPGDLFYVRHEVNALDATDFYSVGEPYRIPTLAFFAALFVLCALLFGGKQGLRGLVALVASFFFIGYLLLPGILHGLNPILVSLGVASLIIIAGSYITHGFTRTTSAAVIGMLLTLLITGLLAWGGIHSGHFSGYTSEEATYLNFDTKGSIDFVGLLLGSLIIGLLGVLYDAAISQAVAVEEFLAIGKHLTRREVYLRGIRVGREHIGALVNTLAIAYVGASLPLLLLFADTVSQSPTVTINQELFASELMRIFIGSIGLMLAVPVTTAVAVYLLWGRVVHREAAENGGHHH